MAPLSGLKKMCDHAAMRGRDRTAPTPGRVASLASTRFKLAGVASVALLTGCSTTVCPPAQKSWFSLEPVDLTSLLGLGPIRAAVSSTDLSALPKRSVLETIAGSLSLVEFPIGAPVAFVAEIHEASEGLDGGQGFPQTISDYVEAKPSTPLAPGDWYELQLLSVPPDVRLEPLGMRKLAGGGVSARFTTGSHPTLQSLHGCAKSNGSFSADLTFSEEVNVTADIGTQVRLEPVDPSDLCTLQMPLTTVTAVRGFLFECQLDASTNRQFRLMVARSVIAPTGAAFEASSGVQGDYSLLIEGSMWQVYDDACSNVVLE